MVGAAKAVVASNPTKHPRRTTGLIMMGPKLAAGHRVFNAYPIE
jgi:hypothetical protein